MKAIANGGQKNLHIGKVFFFEKFKGAEHSFICASLPIENS
jgi:hypothetical protein